MKADYIRPELNALINEYQIVKDCYQGEIAVKKQGKLYLKQSIGMADHLYEDIKYRAKFLPVLNRAIDGFVGLLTKKTASFTASERMMDFIDSKGVNMKKSSLYDIEKNIIEEVMTYGRVGIFTDYVVVDNVQSKADLNKTRNRPVMSVYSSPNIINWNFDDTGILNLVVLKEYIKVDTEDMFIKKSKVQYRALVLDGGIYKQYIFRKDEGAKELYIHDSYDVIVNNKTLDFIPFEIVNYDGSDPDTVPNPPLLDMCSINLKHYFLSADYYGALHMVSIPTPFYKKDRSEQTVPEKDDNGEYIEEDTMVLGFGKMNVIGLNEDVFYLEYSGQGLERIETAMDTLVADMAKIGARFLQNDKAVGESFETEYIRRSGEYSMLASIGVTVSKAIERSLKMMQIWAFNSDDDLEFKIKTNFASNNISDAQLNTLMQLYINQALPYNDLYKALQDAELVDRLKTGEEALAQVREDSMV